MIKPTSYFITLVLIMTGLCFCTPKKPPAEERPNFLFVLADDWSWPHAGAYGDSIIKTPAFDRVARKGVLFDHAYISSPSCTPSRAAILTGQDFWRLKEGANLYGPLRAEFKTYTDLLEQAGYYVGYTKKGWGPGQHTGRKRNPAGDRYNSFTSFLKNRPEGKPFCFWFGSYYPHRGYQQGSGKIAGINPDLIRVPGWMPDVPEVRSDMADYYYEVELFDQQTQILLRQLDSIGETDNTLVVVTGDNGMPFPRAKSNVYDGGTRVPLAIQWGTHIRKPFRTDAFVSLTDLAPTFLEAAGLPVPAEMTGQSLLVLLRTGIPDPEHDRSRIFFGKERHVPGQESGDWGGYPMRAIRTHDYLYIRNFRPDRWPSGTPRFETATLDSSWYGDVDNGPTKNYMIQHRHDDTRSARLFRLAFEKRPAEELYDVHQDPYLLNNLADDKKYSGVLRELSKQLTEELKKTGDPRITGHAEVFENYPYSGGTPKPSMVGKKH